jgi:hypothetical protein
MKDTYEVGSMSKGPKIDKEVLLNAGLELMRRTGQLLSPRPSRGPSKVYELPDGRTVRARTSNDHVLIVLAEQASLDAKLNIEGTDLLLVVMPEIERMPGNVIGYLIPTTEAVAAVRQTHREWLARKPNTESDNRTWALYFRPNGFTGAKDFSAVWSKYRLKGDGPTDVVEVDPVRTGPTVPGNIKAEVEAARQRIARVAGVAASAVRITIDFGL